MARTIHAHDLGAATARIERLSHMLDTRWRLPVIGARFGVDPLLGLVPVLGDAAAAAIGGYILIEAWRLGAPASLVVRMLANIGIDALVGSIPILGTIFDVAFRAHRRNAALLRRHLNERSAAPAGTTHFVAA